ncbi:MAG: metallophosphoesterase [Candidatus Omnitrophica bacterium]|nr:metallophosphoesterase [Candidatus Omnitrophota bacterium]
MKTFCIGDIHGAYQALLQCFKRSGFDYQSDRLIALGDVCDGYPQVHLCIDELLKIKHCDYIIGNHDVWALDWALRGDKPDIWTSQGGAGTILSYSGGPVPQTHVDFLKNAHPWLEVGKKLFVHGGFDPRIPLAQQSLEKLVWDRDLLYSAWKKYLTGEDYQFSGYEEIFVGHTTTETFHSTLPLHLCNVWALDTGAGWSGPLTIMDIQTKQYWQSDVTTKLYQGFRSR